MREVLGLGSRQRSLIYRKIFGEDGMLKTTTDKVDFPPKVDSFIEELQNNGTLGRDPEAKYLKFFFKRLQSNVLHPSLVSICTSIKKTHTS